MVVATWLSGARVLLRKEHTSRSCHTNHRQPRAHGVQWQFLAFEISPPGSLEHPTATCQPTYAALQRFSVASICHEAAQPGS